MPNGLFYNHISDRSVSNIWGVWLVFIITMFCRKSCIQCEQCRLWSDAAFCGVWSESALFANVPFMGHKLVNTIYRDSVNEQLIRSHDLAGRSKHLPLAFVTSPSLDWNFRSKKGLFIYRLLYNSCPVWACAVGIGPEPRVFCDASSVKPFAPKFLQ